jgi:ketosteroid isomerase-like protein
MKIKSLVIASLLVCINISSINAQQETKTATNLLNSFLESVNIGNAKLSASYFADNGYIEAPYVVSLGMPSKIEGQKAIESTMKMVKQMAPNFHFINIKIIMETHNEVVAEYESEATMTNGKPYKQHYIAHLVCKDNKIISHREFLNTIVFVEAFFPNGLKDLLPK